VSPDSRATNAVFRAFLAAGFVSAAYGIVSVGIEWMRAISGNSSIDVFAGVMGISLVCVVLAILLVVIAFLARWSMRRIVRTDT
jgi:hypothetical protein